MGYLVGLVMGAAAVTIVLWLARGDGPRWAAWLSLALCVPPVLLAQVRIFPAAVRLGGRQDTQEEQTRLARSICHAHLACISSIVAFTTLQIWLASA
jgi:hypothetical protein